MLHLFIACRITTSVLLVISESAAVWHDLNSSWCGHR